MLSEHGYSWLFHIINAYFLVFLQVLKMEESQLFYSAELEMLDPLPCKAANMKIDFQPDMHATKVTIDFDEV